MLTARLLEAWSAAVRVVGGRDSWFDVNNVGDALHRSRRQRDKTGQWATSATRPRTLQSSGILCGWTSTSACRTRGLVSNPLVRRVGADSSASLALLWARANARRVGERLPDSVDDATIEALTRRLQIPGTRAIVAEVDRRVVAGCFAAAALIDGRPVPGRAHISGVAVEPAQWGRGFGTLVTDAIVETRHRRRLRHGSACGTRSKSPSSFAIRADGLAPDQDRASAC